MIIIIIGNFILINTKKKTSVINNVSFFNILDILKFNDYFLSHQRKA